MSKKLAYIRVSTVEQNEARQVEAIKEAIGKVDKSFIDKTSGGSTKRPKLKELLEYVRDGDIIIVHSMDRLARNVRDLREIVESLTSKGVTVKFLKEALEFNGDDNAMSNLILTMLGAVAEFERSIIRERQREGIELAKKEGRYKGRTPKLNDEQIKELRDKVASGVPKAKVAREYDISRQALYNYLEG